MDAQEKTIVLKPTQFDICKRVLRSVDYIPTSPLRVGIVEHYSGDLAGYCEGARDARIIAVFDATEEGVASAYETLEKIEKNINKRNF